MAEQLLSVGIDVGTTTTQLVVSRLWVENRGSAFSVPEMVIGNREIQYRSPVYFTPLIGKDLVDGEKIRNIVVSEYEKAGIRREAVDTGAIIITGETSRRENARAVLEALSGFAGDFVVATAGPDLESVLAAKGAEAVEFSEKTGKTVLHMDIGGGTSNLALIRAGKIVETGCLNVGGRLIKLSPEGKAEYVSPVLKGVCSLHPGDLVTEEQAKQVAQKLVQVLEMAAGMREPTQLLRQLWTKEAGQNDWRIAIPACGPGQNDGDLVISFSGGVADCVENRYPWLEFGDIGPVLGQMIRNSRLCQGEYRLGQETIRATVIGAGSHSIQLSGSTVYHRGVEFPLKNLPVVWADEKSQKDPEEIRRLLEGQDTDAVLAIPGQDAPCYGDVVELAGAITAGFGRRPVMVAVEQDMAKALGQQIALRLSGRQVLCVDGVKLQQGDYLDVGAPVGAALPVVVKTLVLGR